MDVKNINLFSIDRDPQTSSNPVDFLLEIDHFKTQITNREKHMQIDSFKVLSISHQSIRFLLFSILILALQNH